MCASQHDESSVIMSRYHLRATTHSDLIVRAHEMGIKYEVVHNASILNAVSCCGLQLYRFGETVSIPFWTDDWKPDSFIDKIERNLEGGLHTLCLLGEVIIIIVISCVKVKKSA